MQKKNKNVIIFTSRGTQRKGQKEKNMKLFNSPDWNIEGRVTPKGSIVFMAYYRGLFMGFVNIGDFKTQALFIHTCCPELETLAQKQKEQRKEIKD